MNIIKLTDCTFREIILMAFKRLLLPFHLLLYLFYIFALFILPNIFWINVLLTMGFLQVLLYQTYKCYVAFTGEIHTLGKVSISVPLLGSEIVNQPSLVHAISEDTFYIVYYGKLNIRKSQPIFIKNPLQLEQTLNNLREVVKFKEEASAKYLINYFNGNYQNLGIKKKNDADLA